MGRKDVVVVEGRMMQDKVWKIVWLIGIEIEIKNLLNSK